MRFINTIVLLLALTVGMQSAFAGKITIGSGANIDQRGAVAFNAQSPSEILGFLQRSLNVAGGVKGSIRAVLLTAAKSEIASAQINLADLNLVNGEAGLLFLDGTTGTESAMGSADGTHLHYNLAANTAYFVRLRVSGFFGSDTVFQINNDVEIPVKILLTTGGTGGFIVYEMSVAVAP